jgi:hypothetical protein
MVAKDKMACVEMAIEILDLALVGKVVQEVVQEQV